MSWEKRQPTAPGPLKSSGMETGRSVAFRWTFLAVADAGAKATGFAATLAIIRHFGAEMFGSLTLATSLVAYVLVIAVGGTDIYAVRLVASRPAQMLAVLSAVTSLRFVLAAASYLVLLAVAWSVPSIRPVMGLVAVAGLSLFSGALTTAWVPQALQQTHVLAAVTFGTQLCYLALVLGGLAMNLGLWSAPVALVLAECCGAGALLGWLRRRYGPWKPTLVPNEWRGILRQSAPIAASSLLRTVALGSDVILLSLFVPMLEIGYYSGAHKIFLLGVSSIGVYFIIFLPRLAQQAAVSPAAMRGDVIASLKWALPGILAGAAILTFFAEAILRLMLGASFVAATGSLQILFLAAVVSFVSGHGRNALLARGQQQLDLLFVGIASVAHVAFKTILIPIVGIDGAALGTCMGELVLMTLTLWASLGRLPDRPFPGNQPPLGKLPL